MAAKCFDSANGHIDTHCLDNHIHIKRSLDAPHSSHVGEVWYIFIGNFMLVIVGWGRRF